MKDTIAKIKDWWANLAAREKRMLLIGGVISAIFILYAGILMPYRNHVDSMREKLVQNQKLLTWMRAADQELKKHTTQDGKNTQSVSPVTLLGLIQKKIDKVGLASSLKQLKQASNETIEMHFEKIAFDKLMELLITLSKEQKVILDQFTTTAVGDDGIVNADVIVRIV